jgi:hypothetical protein
MSEHVLLDMCLSRALQWLSDGRRVALNIDSSVKIFDVQHHRSYAANFSDSPFLHSLSVFAEMVRRPLLT